MTAKIDGLERLAPQLRQAASEVGNGLKSTLMDGAEAVAANARGRVLALKDEGGPSKLTESIRVEETDTGAQVIADASHAPHVEFGTRRQAAQPFLAPALEEERAGIIERAGRMLRQGGGA
jgi:HK97 gp10 family phage protein